MSSTRGLQRRKQREQRKKRNEGTKGQGTVQSCNRPIKKGREPVVCLRFCSDLVARPCGASGAFAATEEEEKSRAEVRGRGGGVRGQIGGRLGEEGEKRGLEMKER